MFNICLLRLVQVDLDESRAVQLDTNTLANDLSWKDQIVQRGLVHSSERAASGSLLLVASASLACWLGQNSSLKRKKNKS